MSLFILSEKNNAGGIIILDFKLYYRAIAIKQHGTGTKTNMKTNGTEDPDMTPRSWAHLIFYKGAQNI
jgi:hypothetical protein